MPPDVPQQYKDMQDAANRELVAAARKVWAICTELGCNNFEIDAGDVVILVRGGRH